MYKFYFITGSQGMYGQETLDQVAQHSQAMVKAFNASKNIPFEIVWQPTVTTSKEILDVIEKANFDKECAGIITFMHTFSPSKMWISGLTKLNKPYCHLHTQFNREIPFADIDMDFMNLNQSAHGDREHGFIAARLRMPRKIVVGYWENEDVQLRLADFMRAASGVMESRSLCVARFSDNMREVAVTDGDKVEAQIKLGWSVNCYSEGDLAEYVNAVSCADVNKLYNEACEKYTLKTDDIDSVKYQIRMEIGMERFLQDGGYKAFTTNFQALHGLDQLPGLASQMLMEKGYGFGGEGDWKVSAMTRIMKVMGAGLGSGTSFMEDYTYHLEQDNEMILGAHMLEVCPTIAATKPTIEVEPLGIGGKNPPARLKFDGNAGDAICVSLVDMGGRLRLIVTDVKAVAPLKPMPKLPVAGVMWKPLPDLQTAAEAWILAGGAHHTTMSYSLNAQNMRDFAEMMDIEFVHIGEHTCINEMKKELLWNDIAYKLGR